MRPSLSLAVLALFGNFAYGFSSPPAKPLSTRALLARQPHGPVAAKSTPIDIMTSTSRGGALKATSNGDSSNNMTPFKFMASFWGTTGVIYILAKAIRRVIPIAIEPFLETSTPLSQFQLG